MLRGARVFIVLSILLLLSLVMLPTSGLSRQTTVSAATQQATANPVIAKIQSLIRKTGKDSRIPLGGYGTMSKELQTDLLQLGVPADPESVFDLSQANYFVDSTTNTLKEIVAPLSGAGSAKLSATDSKTPDDSKAAKIIGAVYAPLVYQKAMVLVYVPDKTPTLRFYADGKAAIKPYALTTPELRKFTGAPPEQKDASANQSASYDQDAIVSALETCFTVGLDQVCYRSPQPDLNAQKTVQDAMISLRVAADAKNNLIFPDLSRVKFDITGAISDLVGDDQRMACVQALVEARSPQPLPDECRPTVMFTTVKYESLADIPQMKGYEDSQLVGIWVVVDKHGLKLNTNGNTENPMGEIYDATTADHVSALPAGAYLWFITSQQGQPALCRLTNAQGKEFVITGHHAEGFGQTSDQKASSALQAFVMDPAGAGAGCP